MVTHSRKKKRCKLLFIMQIIPQHEIFQQLVRYRKTEDVSFRTWGCLSFKAFKRQNLDGYAKKVASFNTNSTNTTIYVNLTIRNDNSLSAVHISHYFGILFQ